MDEYLLTKKFISGELNKHKYLELMKEISYSRHCEIDNKKNKQSMSSTKWV
jgi:hypothetical protein